MLNPFIKKDKRSVLEKEIDDVVVLMGTYDPSSKEYTAMAENLERLKKADACKGKAGLTPDGILSAGVYLAGLVLVLQHEKLDIIKSKAFGQLMKVRL